MKRLMNFTVFEHDVGRYMDSRDLQCFYKDRGLDGLELMLDMENPFPEIIPRDDVVGVHLRMFPYWLDLWKGNQTALLENFGTEEALLSFYGGIGGRGAIYRRLERELWEAEALGAQYVVFHVSDVSFVEAWDRRFIHGDAEVIDTACTLINELLDVGGYTFDFLVENLWWPGFTMTDPWLTKRLLDGIHYEHKGIMLDVGHLLHTNLELSDMDQSVRYVKKMLERHKGLIHEIKGIHLHQSLTGDYVKAMLVGYSRETVSDQGFFWKTMGHVYNMDTHQPWVDGDFMSIIKAVDPKYLVLEFVTADRQEHGEKLDIQLKAMC